MFGDASIHSSELISGRILNVDFFSFGAGFDLETIRLGAGAGALVGAGDRDTYNRFKFIYGLHLRVSEFLLSFAWTLLLVLDCLSDVCYLKSFYDWMLI